ncbi:MAG TPA: sigma factor-like helix-turn-helix DNA-binding protein [Candidatus Saccharimonadales bacterium]|nr:sigma factor-like helix-turn-helix DNA-binding protein [Candidatus Saccharimonadales bacterium]
MAESTITAAQSTEQLVNDVLKTIEREREREIVARRFGLFDRKETLEQIGELLGITRERVRQLEKSVVTRLKTTAEQQGLPHVPEFEAKLLSILSQMGKVARVSDLTAKLTSKVTREEQGRVSFLAQLCPELVVISEDDNFYHSVGIKKAHDEKALKAEVAKLIEAIKNLAQPKTIEEIAKAAGFEDTKHAEALASTSKQLATLNGRWGLVKWPMVNPRTSAIRFTSS